MIWRVQTCSCSKTCKQNLEISTSLKLFKKDSVTHRQEHHIMQVLKSGVTCPMILKVISGPLVVSSMRCAHLFHHSEQMICKAFTRKSSKGSFQGSQTTSVRKWQQSLSSCCKYPPTTDHLVTKYWHCLLLRHYLANSSQKRSSSKTIQKLLIYWELSGLAAICSR